MKKTLFVIFLIAASTAGFSQKVDSIYFNLYTDSLKKGTHNYINIDGKYSDGKWLPLSSKEIEFKASYGNFEGNDLVLPDSPTVRKITVKAILKSNPSVWKEVTIWIKTLPDPDNLPTNQEVLERLKKEGKKKKKGSNSFS